MFYVNKQCVPTVCWNANCFQYEQITVTRTRRREREHVTCVQIQFRFLSAAKLLFYRCHVALIGFVKCRIEINSERQLIDFVFFHFISDFHRRQLSIHNFEKKSKLNIYSSWILITFREGNHCKKRAKIRRNNSCDPCNDGILLLLSDIHRSNRISPARAFYASDAEIINSVWQCLVLWRL